MLVNQGGTCVDDCHGYGGLGRFVKSNVPANRIVVLPSLDEKALKISEEASKTPLSQEEGNAVMAYFSVLYRKKLLSFLRSQKQSNMV